MKKFVLCVAFLITTISLSAQVVANQADNLYACDIDNNGFEVFDLTVNDVIILGIQNPAENVITYYETLADALNGTNPIVTSSSYVSVGNQTIFARIEEVATGDFDTTNFELYVNPIPPDLGPFEMTLCDDEIGGSTSTDGISTFNLTSINNTATNGDPSLTVA